MTLCFLFERNWQHENIERFMMFNERRRWPHSSRVKLTLVSMPASWFLVSTCLIWILEVQIDSKNQSRATLCVLDTCLIVGLLPLMITLITASLSSKMALRRIFVCGDVVHVRQLINKHLGFPIVRVWICDFANSFLLRVWLVVWCCSVNVTLLCGVGWWFGAVR